MRLQIRKKMVLFLSAAIFMVMVVGCADDNLNQNLNQTGVFDQNGNLITNTLIYTNRVSFNGNIPKWATNLKVDFVVITNITDVTNTNVQIIYDTNYYLPNLPESATDYYQIYFPYAVKGDEFVTVSYKDMTKIKQLWLDQLFRKSEDDGRVFAIRNRDNNRGYWYEVLSFQDPVEYKGREDYYYFADNGDIVYKGGDKDNKHGETVIKKFAGAALVNYRSRNKNNENTGILTIGGIYKMAIDVNDARSKFKGGGAAEGVYDFIAARNGKKFLRQYYSTEFIEILVFNPFGNSAGIYRDGCMSLDSYYAYYGTDNREGAYPVKGFEPDNIPYMTEEHLYIAKRPEWIIPYLNKWTFFSESNGWKYLVMPGYPN